MDPIPEIILIDKPKGITSFGVIRELRKIFGIKKMGHAGTLDPLATGLMIIGIGSGTKKLTELTGLDKIYVAEVRIGERRTTGDLEGAIVEEKAVGETAEILRSKISAALADMQGELSLPVSAYSAIKVNGVPMYKHARKAEVTGETVLELPIRTMRIDKGELLDLYVEFGRAVATIRFSVSKGTYIRSLAEELGKRLGYPATLQDLRRTHIGSYSITNATTLVALEKAAARSSSAS